MALHPSIPLRGGTTIPANQIEGRVEFNNVKFAYPTRPEQVTTFHLSFLSPSLSLPLSSLLLSLPFLLLPPSPSLPLSLPFLLLSSSPLPPSLFFSSNEACYLVPQVVLEDFTLELPRGMVTALCGLSGAGVWVII